MRFKPQGARELHNYAFIVITEDDEDQRRSGDTRRYFNYYHAGQVVICDVTGGSPIEVGTHGKPGHEGCEQTRQLQILRDAINLAYEVVGAGGGGYRGLSAYRYLVITETDEDRRPPTDKREYHDYYHFGQIVICDVAGGHPVEVGTYMKPGKSNCASEEFMQLDQAISFSYQLTGTGWDRKKGGYRIKQKAKGPRRQKRRHTA